MPIRGGTPYFGLYGEAPPKRGTFFKLQEKGWEFTSLGIEKVGFHNASIKKGS